MKIPDTVRLNGIDYKVQYVDDLNDGANVLYGHIDYNKKQICLNSNVQEHQGMCVTLLHEVLHGIFWQHGMELDDELEEKLCDVMAYGMYQLLQDNGRKLFDLMPVDEKEETK